MKKKNEKTQKTMIRKILVFSFVALVFGVLGRFSVVGTPVAVTFVFLACSNVFYYIGRLVENVKLVG